MGRRDRTVRHLRRRLRRQSVPTHRPRRVHGLQHHQCPRSASWENGGTAARAGPGRTTNPARSRPCGSSTSTARPSSSTRGRRPDHQPGRKLNSPPCSTRSASSGHEPRHAEPETRQYCRLVPSVPVYGGLTRKRLFVLLAVTTGAFLSAASPATAEDSEFIPASDNGCAVDLQVSVGGHDHQARIGTGDIAITNLDNGATYLQRSRHVETGRSIQSRGTGT